MAKLFASEAAFEIATEAMRIHGGVGYTTEFPIERYYRDAMLMCIGEGANEVLKTVIAGPHGEVVDFAKPAGHVPPIVHDSSASENSQTRSGRRFPREFRDDAGTLQVKHGDQGTLAGEGAERL